MTAPLIEVEVRWTAQDWDDRERGDHPLFTPYLLAVAPGAAPQGVGRAFIRSFTRTAPAAVERAGRSLGVDADGVPTTPTEPLREPSALIMASAEVTTVLPELPDGGRPALQGWSEVDQQIHRVQREQAPLRGGLWWAHCDRLVIRGRARDPRDVPLRQWCPKCWDVLALQAKYGQAAETNPSSTCASAVMPEVGGMP